jgi:hypothetical protein
MSAREEKKNGRNNLRGTDDDDGVKPKDFWTDGQGHQK